eukprot:TRINITY_DN101528_c0_g1_i2.p1 TRINITY_DN101528_c0_g1~~TRINITY_DN101528_c0_g1_i2.p1  ORF type:complete len:271 (-),score=93.78 TRINITY_DN101528_c0_g1_i2:523-1335(-)
MRSGNVRDSMEAEHSKTETKRLRDLVAERQARIAELEALLANMKAERDNFSMMLRDKEQEFESLEISSKRKESEMQSQIESLIAQLNDLIDRKMSLELEIACYKKLLEGEESRTGLRQLVEQTIGVRSAGAANLADIIGQSNMQSSTTARTTVQRTSKGNICFNSVDPMGAFIMLENTSSGNRGKPQNLKGWKITKSLGEKIFFTEELPDHVIEGGKVFTVFASGAKKPEDMKEQEMISGQFTFGMGNALYRLLDGNGQEKATMTVRMQE